MSARTTQRLGANGRRRSKTRAAAKNEKKRAEATSSIGNDAQALEAANEPREDLPADGASDLPTSHSPAKETSPKELPAKEPADKALPPAIAKTASETNGAGKPDFERLSYNMARLVEQGGKALAACLRPPEAGEVKSDLSVEVADAVRSLGRVAEYWLNDPAKSLEAQSTLATNFLALWGHTLRRLSGGFEDPIVPYDPTDKRFAAPEWRESPFFDFLRQAHAIGSHWANDLVDRTDELDPHVRDKAKFYLRQISSALSPSNFFATNPEILKETWATNGDNLVRGASFLARDIEAGKGMLKISRVDSSKFEVGVNLATTPGKVIYRNDLIELIQYAPTTDAVYKRPLLIIPPWINKFYILDLSPEKSFVRWAVSQGLTVFIVSWVNPDARHRDKGFEDYMREGILAALEAIEQATGEKKVSAIGYCIGGTLLAMTLAYMAELGDDRIESASFFTTQTDFSQAGDLKIFVDEDHLRDLESKMAATGYLDASAMEASFNMLRPDDLIWSYVVNNYMKGKAPLAFDLLAWNSDSTRMPAANHLAYLRHCYLENRLAKGKAVFGGKTLDLAKITLPVYHLATREDHIAPARSVFIGAKLFGGDVRYVLAGSGHIAGVVNPVSKPKYQYWLGESPSGAFEDWLMTAIEHKGSWWADWIEWITRQSPEKVPARQPGDGALAPICDAPGEYVRIRH
ncbi:PHA/PHB synthase family protein [Methylocapsa aurea]|uniref:PHA/PHB synthase family protein n=1 Tax=Methylocapsa aurea TaxID=663610 RepID=UPI000A00FA19|nr:class I poly(R)-hydroxyalkanoic acid synthase [Methylocapsa aurea]